MTFADLDLAEARAKVQEAIDKGRRTFPPFETDTWPGSRPLVERILRELPAGGAGYEAPEWSEEERTPDSPCANRMKRRSTAGAPTRTSTTRRRRRGSASPRSPP
jgi:hypothetical protein